MNGDTEIGGDLTVSGTITCTVSGTIAQADDVKIGDAPNDTTNYLVSTRNSTAGYKRLYEGADLRWDSTNNRLYVFVLMTDLSTTETVTRSSGFLRTTRQRYGLTAKIGCM